MPAQKAKKHGLAIFVLLLLLGVAFYDVVLFEKTFKVTTANSQALPEGAYGQLLNKPKFIPVNGTDAPVLEEPIYAFIRRNLKLGIFPLWNPHQACGYPLVGMIQVGIFYPLNLILYLLPELYSWDIFIFIRILLSGIFVYCLMQTLKFSRIPSLVAAISFMLSGPMLLLQYWTANVDILLPILLIACERLIRTSKKHNIAFLGFTVALTIFGGHPEHIFLVNVYAAAFFIFRLFVLRKEIDYKKPLVYFFLSYMLGAALSAIVLFPFLQNFSSEFWHGHPQRVGLLMEENRCRALSLALPHFFQQVPLTYKWVFSGWWGGYIGTIPLAFAFLSLFHKHKNKLNYFFVATALIIIGKQYGMPVINWIGYLPLFSMCRYAIHTPALAAFSVAVAAGIGVHTILDNVNIFKKGLIFSGSLLSIAAINLIILKWPQIFNISQDSLCYNIPLNIPLKAILFVAAVLLIFLSILFLKDKKIITKKTTSILLASILFLELFLYIHRERPYRFASFSKVPYIELLKSSNEKIRNYGNLWAFYPNTATGFGLDDLGYFFGLVPKRFVYFVNKLILKDYFKSNLNPPALRAMPIKGRENILDLLNVRYIISPADENKYLRMMPHLRDATKHLNLVYNKEVRIYRRPNTFPRAYIVHRAIFQPDENKSLALIHQIGPQLRHVAVINHAPILKVISLLKTTPAIDESIAEIIKYTPNEVVINVDMEHAGFLVLSDAFHPDWKAWIDGKKWKVFQTNYLLRSVFVPSGKHTIKFSFKPTSFYLGMYVSLGALIIIIFLSGIHPFTRNKKRSLS